MAVVQLALPLVRAVNESIPLVGQFSHFTADAARQLTCLLFGATVPPRIPIQVTSRYTEQHKSINNNSAGRGVYLQNLGITNNLKMKLNGSYGSS